MGSQTRMTRSAHKKPQAFSKLAASIKKPQVFASNHVSLLLPKRQESKKALAKTAKAWFYPIKFFLFFLFYIKRRPEWDHFGCIHFQLSRFQKSHRIPRQIRLSGSISHPTILIELGSMSRTSKAFA